MTRSIKALTSALTIAFLSASSASADTLLVPDTYATIQAAIDAAVDRDVVVVADGVYTGPGNRDLDFGGRAITVRSENGAADCAIDLQASARAVRFHSGETAASTLEGFTIINGVTGNGGAMLIENGSSPTITGCSFEDNTVSSVIGFTGGGAVSISGGQPTFCECDFSGNHVNAIDDTGGGAAYIESSTVSFSGCDFTSNSMTGAPQDGGGGAIRNIGSNLAFTDCTFSSNTSTFVGGAIINHAGGQTAMTSCVFENNSAGGGGAIINGGDSIMTLTACTFTSNFSKFGGAVLSNPPSELTAVNCVFQGNFTTHGGGVPNDNAGGAMVAHSVVTLDNCQFIENIADDCCGAVAFTGGADADVRNCSFISNVATNSNSGAAYVNNDSQATFANCLFLNNVTPANGGGIRLNLGTGGHVDIVNCTFSGNEAGSGAGSGNGIHYQGNGGTASVSNSILWENAAPQIVQSGSGLSVTYCDVEGGWPGTGNIADDPLFVDPDGADDNPETWQDNDYRLAAGSLCIDAGNNSAVPKEIETDLDGHQRFVDDPDTTDTGVGGPPTVDIGAYEFQTCPTDLNGDNTVNAADLAILLGNWGPVPPGGPVADLNHDGIVNATDLAILLGNWGPCL